MNLPGLLFLLCMHFLCGRALLHIFDIRLKPVATFALSMINGIMVVSLLPFLLQLCYIPITTASTVISITACTIALNITQLKKYKRPDIGSIAAGVRSIPLYEWLFIIVFIILMIPSAWRCFIYPPNARDILSGAEAVAEFTVREHSMINSVFKVDLTSTNNHLKPPYITCLQIIYKQLVHPFGQVWLSVFCISFLTWMYTLVRAQLHGVIAGMLFLLFMTIPDVYAYTYMLLYDYSNMALFFAGVYFLLQYASTRQYKTFLFSSLLFGFATYIRSETLVFTGMLLPLVLYIFYKEQLGAARTALRTALFLLIPFLFYFIWMGVFVKYYMPVQFDVQSQLNHNLGDLSPIFTRLHEMNTEYLLGGNNIKIYGYFINVFIAVFIADAIFFRGTLKKQWMLLYAIAIVYIGLPILGYLIPWYDLSNTTKRGAFKLLPLMLLYMANSGVLLRLSAAIQNWEYNIQPEPTPETVQVSPGTPAPGKKKKQKR